MDDSIMDDIQMAQVKAGEDAVVERLQQKGLLPREDGRWPTVEERQRTESVAIFQRQQLESTLARTFMQWRRTVDPSGRSRLWNAMEEAVGELEKLSDER